MDFKEQLWQTFKEKIKADWDKEYYLIAPSLEELKGAKTNIARAISSDIRRVTNAGISMDTINRYLTNDGFAGEVKTNTLDIFAAYVGFLDWDDFQKSHSPAALSTPESGPLGKASSWPVLFTNFKMKKPASQLILLLALLVAALLISTVQDTGFLLRQAQIILFVGTLVATTVLVAKELNN